MSIIKHFSIAVPEEPTVTVYSRFDYNNNTFTGFHIDDAVGGIDITTGTFTTNAEGVIILYTKSNEGYEEEAEIDVEMREIMIPITEREFLIAMGVL